MSKKEYIFLPQEGDDSFFHILLKESSPFPSVEYQYGAVSFEELPNGTLKVKFEHEIFDNPEDCHVEDQDFINYIGSILIENLEKILSE